MAVPASLEREVNEARAKITDERKLGAEARKAADKVIADYKAKNVDILGDDDAFKASDEALKVADGHFEAAADLERKVARLLDHSEDSNAALAAAMDDGDAEHPEVRKAAALRLGAKFLASDEYKALKGSKALTNGGARVHTDPVECATRDELKSVLFLAATLDASELIDVDQRLFPPVEFPVRQLRVRDLVTVSDTDSDTINWVQETTRTDAAAETPYGTDAPEATYVFTPKSNTVKRIPQWKAATKGQLADQGQLRSLIDNHLMYGVGKRLDSQMVAGDGVGDNLTGILTEAIGAQALGADSRSDAFHKAITVVRIALEDEPTAWLLHPSDYQDFVLEKDGEGRYINVAGATGAGPATVWGKPAVVSTVIAAGTGLVGDFKRGAELWVRSGIEVAATDSHSDFFLKGLIAVLAEMRAAFAVTQPKAFCKVTGI